MEVRAKKSKEGGIGTTHQERTVRPIVTAVLLQERDDHARGDADGDEEENGPAKLRDHWHFDD